MRSGVGSLASVVTAMWAIVLGVGHVLADPPLSPVLLVVAGVVLTNVAIMTYGSVLRGPRSRRRRRRPSGSDPTDAVAGSPSRHQREGLTSEAAARTVDLLRPLLGGDAVAITDLEQMLAFVGPGEDHHGAGYPLRARDRATVIQSRRTVRISGRERLNCDHAGCPLQSATIAPLTAGDAVVGTVSVYRESEDAPPREMVESMAGILSLHLELAELEVRSRLNADARLDALRAQINPHFLFNTLNTIASKARTDPEEARALLVRLADFFRYAIRQHGQFAEFAQEYYFVRTYVSLEQARFGDRLAVLYDVDPKVLAVEVPVLMIQPLVENAIKHGLSAKVGRGTVTLRARVDMLAREVVLTVKDDGVGMDQPTLSAVLSGHRGENAVGVAMANISERLTLLYGDRAQFDVRSRQGEGTSIRLRIPLR